MTPSAEQRISLYYALLFGGIGAISPFAALWMNHVGIQASMIGAIVAAPSIAMLLTTLALGRREPEPVCCWLYFVKSYSVPEDPRDCHTSL